MNDAVTAPVVTPPVDGAAPDASADPAVTPPAERKFKLKVDGKEVEYTEADVLKLAQKGTKADKELQTAAQIKQQNIDLIKRIKADPFKVLADPALGLDIKQKIAEYIEANVSESRMTPEQKKARDDALELQRYKEKEANDQKSARQQELDTQADAVAKQWNTELDEILKTNKLPRTPAALNAAAEYMRIAINKGLDITWAQIVPLVKKDIEQAHRDLFGAADEDTLAELLGDELLAKASKAYIKKNNRQPAGNIDKPQVIEQRSGREKPKTMNEREWLKQL